MLVKVEHGILDSLQHIQDRYLTIETILNKALLVAFVDILKPVFFQMTGVRHAEFNNIAVYFQTGFKCFISIHV